MRVFYHKIQDFVEIYFLVLLYLELIMSSLSNRQYVARVKLFGPTEVHVPEKRQRPWHAVPLSQREYEELENYLKTRVFMEFEGEDHQLDREETCLKV